MVHKGSNYDRRYFRRRFDLFRNGAGNPHPDEYVQNDEARTPIEQIDQKISEGLSTNAAIKLVAKKNKLNRQELYKQYHNI